MPFDGKIVTIFFGSGGGAAVAAASAHIAPLILCSQCNIETEQVVYRFMIAFDRHFSHAVHGLGTTKDRASNAWYSSSAVAVVHTFFHYIFRMHDYMTHLK